MAMSGDVKLGGRLFNVVNYDSISVLNEHYIMKLMRETGLDVVLPVGEEESDESYMLRVHAKIVDTLKLHELLAGYLLPAAKTEADWTPAMAKETAAYIAQLTAKEDKSEVHRLGLLVTFDFFKAGLDSLKHSRSVLETLSASPAKSNDPAQEIAAH